MIVRICSSQKDVSLPLSQILLRFAMPHHVMRDFSKCVQHEPLLRFAVPHHFMRDFFKCVQHELFHFRMFLDCFWGLSPIGSRND